MYHNLSLEIVINKDKNPYIAYFYNKKILCKEDRGISQCSFVGW